MIIDYKRKYLAILGFSETDIFLLLSFRPTSGVRTHFEINNDYKRKYLAILGFTELCF